MSTVLSRGPLTDILLATLTAHVNKPVGDAAQPPGAAWGAGPNAPGSTFTPYLVLTPMAATRSSGSIGLPQGEWQMPYAISSYGVLRSQVEWMADQARIALATLRNSVHTFGTVEWKVQQIWTALIDRPVPNYATDPPVWAQHDQVSVWLSEVL